MHEMSLAKNIIDSIHQHLPESQDCNVKSVKLKIGDLAGVVPESLTFCFHVLVEGTFLDKTNLIIEPVKVQAKCRSCHKEFSEEMFMFICPNCESRQIDILSGRELELVELELVDKEEIR